MYKHILVPTDGSPLSLKAAKIAAKLASPLKARITALHVIAPFDPPSHAEAGAFGMDRIMVAYEKSARAQAKTALAKVAAAAGGKCDTSAVVHAAPWRAIIAAAKSKKCDLVVMASHGRGSLASLLLGSETQKVLTHSKVPVLVCR